MKSSIQCAFLARCTDAQIRIAEKTGREYLSLAVTLLDNEDDGSLWVTSFHETHRTTLLAGLKPQQLVHVKGSLRPKFYEKDGAQRCTLWITADEITPLSEPDAMPKPRAKRGTAIKGNEEGCRPLASAQAAGEKAGSRSDHATTQSVQTGSELSLSGLGAGSAIDASLFEPRNPPKLPPEKLMEFQFPAEVTGSKNEYGKGFNEKAGDALPFAPEWR